MQQTHPNSAKPYWNYTRSSATAERQRVSFTRLSRLIQSLTDRALQSHGAILQWRPHNRSWSRFGM